MHPRSVRHGEKPRPLYVVWELTLRCDQACLTCGSRAGLPRERELDTVEAVDLARQLAALGVGEVTLIGGEAYLRRDWAEIARTLVEGGTRCSIVTGGRGFGPKEAEAARDAGVSTVSVSIDGLPATHDALRAVPGSFAAALRALDAVRATGVGATVNTQVNRRNLGELDALADELLPRGLAAWQFQLTTPMGRASGEDLVLQPYEMLELLPRLAAMSKRARAARCHLVTSDNIGYYGPFEADLRPGGPWIGCTAGGWTLGLQSDGLVKGCASLPAAPYGDMNVRDTPLAEIVARSVALSATRDRVERWGFCAGCYYGEVCRGGCTWTGQVLFGRPGNMPHCHHRALELHARGLRERLVPLTEAAPGPFGHGTWEIVEEQVPGR